MLLITHAVKMTEAPKEIRGVPQLPDAVVSDKVPASKDEELGACPDSPKLWSPRALLLLPRRKWLGYLPWNEPYKTKCNKGSLVLVLKNPILDCIKCSNKPDKVSCVNGKGREPLRCWKSHATKTNNGGGDRTPNCYISWRFLCWDPFPCTLRFCHLLQPLKRPHCLCEILCSTMENTEGNTPRRKHT